MILLILKYKTMTLVKIFKLFVYRLANIGKIPLCSGISSRAPHILGICLPLCYRCFFMVISFTITLLILKKKDYYHKLVFLLLIPLIIDGVLQTFFNILSNNIRRSITGVLFGIALAIIINRIFKIIDKFI